MRRLWWSVEKNPLREGCVLISNILTGFENVVGPEVFYKDSEAFSSEFGGGPRFFWRVA